jgi:hypothetical protein
MPRSGSEPALAGAVQWPPLAVASGLLALLLAATATPRHALLLLLGAALGITLFHTAFGFTSAYRRFQLNRETAALYAQLLMLALATVLLTPLLARGEAFGSPLAGALAPAGVSVAIGALLFGIGMQLGDGCGSGTLYKAGGGTPRMLITLAAFCAGSFWASQHMGWWQALPALPVQSLAEPLGYPGAAALQLALLGLLALALRRWRDRQPDNGAALRRGRLLLAGALVLALLNAATLLVAGHPWSITWGFTLWGAKGAMLLGWEPAGDPFWSAPFQQAALASGVLHDVTSLMDIGILLGALAAAGFGGRFAPSFRIPPRSLAAALLGGLLMGYGARISYGCNIGAFFSGVASLSLHGWLWIACALAGSALGVRVRPWFGLAD